MLRRSEGNFRGHNQIELFYQVWEPASPVATLVVTHGLAEHSDCYDYFAQSFNSPEWRIFGWDLRGHGRSEGKRGLIASFQEYCLDLVAFLQFVRSRVGGPIVLFSHSMGGLITIRTVLDNPHLPILAVALSSPQLGIAMKVPVVKEYASRLLHKFLPEITFYNEIRYESLSRDRDRIASYRKDPLRHEKISASLYLGMVENMEYSLHNADRFKLPLLLQQAGKDMIVSAEASRKFFDRVGSSDKKFILYPESYHEIVNDLDYKTVLTDLSQFLERFKNKT